MVFPGEVGSLLIAVSLNPAVLRILVAVVAEEEMCDAVPTAS